MFVINSVYFIISEAEWTSEKKGKGKKETGKGGFGRFFR